MPSLSADNTFILGVVVMICFLAYKFIIEPTINEGKPLDYTEEQYVEDTKPLIDMESVVGDNMDIGISKDHFKDN